MADIDLTLLTDKELRDLPLDVAEEIRRRTAREQAPERVAGVVREAADAGCTGAVIQAAVQAGLAAEAAADVAAAGDRP